MEPISTLLVAGAAGGIGKQVTEMAWTSAARWIKSKYQDHAPAVIAKAEQNSNAFLSSLGLKVAALEQESEITKSLMAAAMIEPSTSVLLQKAVLASAQTDNAGKHEILSDIVSQRLKASPESIYTVTSQMAVDAISHCTTNQLYILAFAVSLTEITPGIASHHQTLQDYHQACTDWINHRFKPYGDLQIGPKDYAHLEAVSCLKFVHVVVNEGDLNFRLKPLWTRGDYCLNTLTLYHLPIGPRIRYLWETERLRSVSLTTVGSLIGTITSDRLCGADLTSFASWQKEGT